MDKRFIINTKKEGEICTEKLEEIAENQHI